jgi:SAM-dependent methyltransferase
MLDPTADDVLSVAAQSPGGTVITMPEANEPSPRQLTARRLYPEIAAGGYSRHDGFVDFFLRVRSLLTSESAVLDFGAGRGAWTEGELAPLQRELRDLKGHVARVVGVDVDPVVLENDSLDEVLQIEPGGRLPFDDETFDLVLADHVLEHVSRTDAPAVAAEFARVLKPGGWISARTPNRWGLIAIAARLVPNRLHVAVLKRLQPGRPAEDVFPTRYAMNTHRDLRRLFPEPQWTLATYGHVGSQQYAGTSAVAWRVASFLDRLTPPRLAPTLMVFARRNEGS